jgi:hypothetical protein
VYLWGSLWVVGLAVVVTLGLVGWSRWQTRRVAKKLKASQEQAAYGLHDLDAEVKKPSRKPEPKPEAPPAVAREPEPEPPPTGASLLDDDLM